MRKYIEMIVRYRRSVLAGALMITALLVSQIGHLKVVIDPNRFLPQSHPYVVTSNRVEDLFAARTVLVIGITAKQGTIYTPEILGKVVRITTKLRSVPDIIKSDVLSFAARKAKSINGNEQGMDVLPIMSTAPATQAEADAVRARVRSNPAYDGILVSQDERSVAILADFKDPAAGFSSIVNNVKPILDAEQDPSVTISTAGLPVLLSGIETFSARLGLLLPLAMVLIAIVLWFAFRSVQGLLLPLLTATLAVIWSLGLMSLFHVPLDVFNATTPVLILAVASGHAVQILKRFYEEYRIQSALTPTDLRGATQKAVVESLTRVGPVMLVAGVVAAIGFLSLLIIEISSVRSFGVMAAGGILSSLVLELTLIPALRSAIKPPKLPAKKASQGWLARRMEALGHLIAGRKAAWIGGIAVAVMVIAGIGATRITYDDSIKSSFSKDVQLSKDDDQLNKTFAGTNTLYVLVEAKKAGRMQDPDVLKAIDGLQRHMQQDPSVGRSLSIADFVRRMNMAMHADDPRFDTIPDTRALIAQYLFLYSSSGDPEDFATYVDNDYQQANIFTFLKEHDTAKFQILVDDLTAYSRQTFPQDVTVSFGGSVAEGAAIHEIVAKAKILNMLQLAAVFFVLTALVFRSLIAGVLVLVPLAVTVLVNVGLMGWTGIPFNVNNSITAAMAVGVGADYVIYLLFRLREERARGESFEEALSKTLVSAGSAIVFIAGSVAAGYSVLLLSHGFWNHIWMGILICTAMITSATASLTLVPVLIKWLRPGFIFGTKQDRLAPVMPMLVAAVFAGSLASHDVKAATPETADQVMTTNFQVDRVVGSKADTRLVLRDEHGGERVRMSSVTTKLEDNGLDNERLVRFSAPEDVKGTSILMVEHSAADDDMWIYLPALGKVRRLVASNKRDSFVGSDFSYGDVIGYPVDQWHHKFAGEDAVDGEACYLIESTPATDAVKETSGYSRRLSCISKTRYVTLYVKLWDTEGDALKEEHFSNFQNVDPAHGKWIYMDSTAKNLQTGHSSEVVFSGYKVDGSVSSSLFSVRTLESGL